VSLNPPLLVAQVGPYPPQKNGIGDYTSDLSHALRRQDDRVSVLTLACWQPGVAAREPDVWRCWDPHSNWPPELLRAVDEARPQLVHIQHGMYMGHGRRTERFLAGLRARRVLTVVTLHGVWPDSFVRRWPRRFHQTLSRHADRVIIHQRAGSIDVLLGHGVPAERVSVIPMGTGTAPAIDRATARRQLDLGDEPMALFAGLVSPRKGLHRVVRAFASVARDVPGTRLLAVGRVRMAHPFDWLYSGWLRGLMHRGRRAGWLDFRPGHVSDEELWLYITSADVMVLPYAKACGSGSAILHRALAAGRPVICSHTPTFAEAIEAWGRELPELFVPPRDSEAWSRALSDFFRRGELRAKAAEASAALGRAYPWSSVAELHLRLYRTLLGPGS
jgi:glycosyltransferase involved in cell wall biosynthesis